MGREIGDLKLTVENERCQNQELLDLKLKNEQQITGLEMELSHLKTVLLDQDLKEENSPAEIRAKINSDNPKLEKTVQIVKNTGNKRTDSRKMIHSADIENSWYEGPTKTYQNPLSASGKINWMKIGKRLEGYLLKILKILKCIKAQHINFRID